MQTILCEMPGWMKHKLESRILGEISVTSDMQIDTTLMAEGEGELKSLLMKVKEESEKVGLMRWMKLEPIIQSEVSQKEKHQYSILTHIFGI